MKLGTIRWDITSRCNLRCKHCETGHFRAQGTALGDMSDTQIQTIVEDIIASKIERVGLLGGEPTISRHFFPVVARLTSAGVHVTVTTNGIRADVKWIEKLLTCWPLQVMISLDGATTETHEMLRGKGTFGRTIQTVKNFVAIRQLTRSRAQLGLSFTLNQFNKQDIDQLYLLAVELQVDFVHIAVVRPVGTAKLFWNTLSLTAQDEWEAGHDILSHYYSNNFPFKLSSPFITNLARKSYMSRGLSVPIVNLFGDEGVTSAYLQSDGRLFPAQFCSEMVPENIQTIRFEDNYAWKHGLLNLWNSPPFIAYRELHHNPNIISNYTPCASCEFRGKFCHPGPVAELNGSRTPFPICTVAAGVLGDGD